MAEGIILAGGYSKRANTNKMALEYKGKPLILSTIEAMQPFVKRIVVVTGHYHKALESILHTQKNVLCVYNDTYHKGMYDSIKKGLMHTKEDVFIMPGDMPLVKPATYETLLKSEGLFRVPTVNNQKGHPIYMEASLRSTLLDSKEYDHLKAFRNAIGFSEIPVEDEGILIDIDTRDDYLQMKRKEERSE
ncbi:MAG: nucleotidyltransferase family protein [Bacillota bacterium]